MGAMGVMGAKWAWEQVGLRSILKYCDFYHKK